MVKWSLHFPLRCKKQKIPHSLVKDFYAKKNKNVLGSFCRRDLSALVT